MSASGQLRSPTALPRGSWIETLKRTVAEFQEDKLQHWAAALTYYAVLSIFPALIVIVSLIGLFADPERVTRVLTDTAGQLGPATAAETFQGARVLRWVAAARHAGALGFNAVLCVAPKLRRPAAAFVEQSHCLDKH